VRRAQNWVRRTQNLDLPYPKHLEKKNEILENFFFLKVTVSANFDFSSVK